MCSTLLSSVIQLPAGMHRYGYKHLSKGNCKLPEDPQFQFLMFSVFYCLIPTTEVSFQHSSPQFLPPERSALPGTSRSFLRGFTSRAGPRTWLTCPMSSCPVPRSMDNIQPREADAFSPRTDLIWSPALQTPESSSSSHYAEMFSQTQFQVVTEIQVSFLL